MPEKSFRDMGLLPLDKKAAIATLKTRLVLVTSDVIRKLPESFPAFQERWDEHIANWGGEPAGSYNDMSIFVHFVVDDLYEKRNIDETHHVFRIFEMLFAEGDESDRNLIALGFLETLQCVKSWRPYGNAAFREFLGPLCRQAWTEIESQWTGKSSLMEVLRAEHRRNR